MWDQASQRLRLVRFQCAGDAGSHDPPPASSSAAFDGWCSRDPPRSLGGTAVLFCLFFRASSPAFPEWGCRMYWLLVKPLEDAGVVQPGWVDSVVMNDYRAGSSIVAHVDPPRLFARPIVTVSFFQPARLVFGASFDPQRTTPPAHVQELSRGSVLLLDGYAANCVTHGIRPEDLHGNRRVSLILRHVIPGAPGYPAPQPAPFLCDHPMRLIGQVQGCWRDPPGGRHSIGR
ncbi:unnamed protein product, partial [Prorocentrum cordatum]